MPLWTPAQLTSSQMMLWLDGNDASTMFDAVSGGSLVADGAAIARWQDKSGNSNHATQSTSGFRPLRTGGGVRFDGTDDRMSLASSITATNYAFFGVLKKRVSGNAAFILASSSGSGGGYVYTDFSDGNIYWTNSTTYNQTTGSGNNLNTVIVCHDTTTLFRNGTSISVSSGVNSGTTINTVGARLGSASFANADVYELVLCQSSLTRFAVVFEGYFAHKFSLQSSLPTDHPFKTNAPAVGAGSLQHPMYQQVIG